MTAETSTAERAAHESDSGDHAHAGHPSEWQYVKIAIFLAIVTAIEVALYYVAENETVASVQTPVLLVLAAVKFGVVAMYFMHLKFDNRLFRRLFVTGLITAVFVYVVYLGTLGFFNQ